MDNTHYVTHPIPPVYDGASEILILGSFPSVKSREEGTKAAAMDNQVDPEVAAHRGEVIMEQQYDIFTDRQNDLVGTVLRCVIDDYGDEPGTYAGRTWMDAPEIDSAITILSRRPLIPGDFVDVEITGTDEYDLIGETL